MSHVYRLAVATCLGSIIVGLPVIAGATGVGQQAAVNTDAVSWELSRTAYLRDLALSSAAIESRERNDYAAKADLINARYFIRIAEIEDQDLNRHNSAREDLRRARRFLALAKGEINAGEGAQIQQILDKLPKAGMKHPPACDNLDQNELRRHYDQLAAEVDDLVKNI